MTSEELTLILDLRAASTLSELKAALLHIALGGEDMWAKEPHYRHPMALAMDVISTHSPQTAVSASMMSSVVGRPAAALARLNWLNEHYPDGVYCANGS